MKKKHSVEELNKILQKAKAERDEYCSTYGLTPDDMWILLPLSIHQEILHKCERTSEGEDRITQKAILGMHAIHDEMKRVYVIPKRRLPRDDSQQIPTNHLK